MVVPGPSVAGSVTATTVTPLFGFTRYFMDWRASPESTHVVNTQTDHGTPVETPVIGAWPGCSLSSSPSFREFRIAAADRLEGSRCAAAPVFLVPAVQGLSLQAFGAQEQMEVGHVPMRSVPVRMDLILHFFSAWATAGSRARIPSSQADLN